MTAVLSWASTLLAVSILFIIGALFVLQAARVLEDLWLAWRTPAWEEQVMNLLFAAEPSPEFVRRMSRPWTRIVVQNILYKVAPNLDGASKEKCAWLFEAMGSVDREIWRLRARSAFVRGRAAYRLGQMGSRRSIQPLIGTLEDSWVDVRYAAVLALGRLEAGEAVMLILTHAGGFEAYHRPAIVEVVKRLGLVDQKEARAYVVETMLVQSSTFRLGVALAGALQLFEAIPKFWSRFESVSAETKMDIAKAVGTMGHPSAAKALAMFLNDPEPEVRRAILRALGQLGEVSVIPWVIPKIKDPVWDVSEAAVQALAALDQSGETLAGLLESDEEDMVKFKAAMQLEAMGVVDRWTEEVTTASGEALHRVRQRLRLAVKYDADQPIMKKLWHGPHVN